jgi:hypothetical protein
VKHGVVFYFFFEVSPEGANEPPPEYFLFIKKKGRKRPGENYNRGKLKGYHKTLNQEAEQN